MPPATTRSLRNGITPTIGATRGDLRFDAVNLVNGHTPYPQAL
jgi:hypothetical protein